MPLNAKHPLMLTKNVYMLISRLDTNNDQPIRQPRNMSSAVSANNLQNHDFPFVIISGLSETTRKTGATENVGMENAGSNYRGGKCRTGKHGNDTCMGSET